MISLNGLPTREIDGLPYAVHQISENQWQIVIQNCARHPAGYSFDKVYSSRDDAVAALENWPEADNVIHNLAGDDTGAAELGYTEL